LGKYTGGTNIDLFIQNYFAGTYLGGVSSFKMYEKPLDIGEIRHNYNLEKCRYNFKGNFGGRLIVLPEYRCEVLPCIPQFFDNALIVDDFSGYNVDTQQDNPNTNINDEEYLIL
jgi:hypothetical protein